MKEGNVRAAEESRAAAERDLAELELASLKVSIPGKDGEITQLLVSVREGEHPVIVAEH